ncbi:hypothetical protein C9374_001184 [Naegleria lovaniensis]|uniref:Uncharacterized protein n=1 Tax=Naegleria lovaniensis TaxID=51637 RepID=A0AA88GRM0_NAELO|nr:uncharacterized protein C9374_001184 [Naegleria lovaniensis]KAG2387590.1 hypothetical protein C9374_001184 [Naegleria lovaniensis]
MRLYISCTHCAKENRTFCLYIGNVKRGPKKHKDDMEDEDETSVLSKENIDGIYKIIYQNIANIKSDPQVISKLSFELFKKIVDKLLPNSERDLVHQIVKVALLPPTEPFTGDMDYYFKYFYKLEKKTLL